jgi:tricorn protease
MNSRPARTALALFAVVLTLIILLPAAASAREGRLMRDPHLSAGRVVFTWEDDLWTVDDDGGRAVRLTSHPGEERYARLSPDGTQIACTAGYDGGRDVYIIPADGGEPRRLTWHPAEDEVLGWTPDGASVIFRSRRTRQTELYSVSAAGGVPLNLGLDKVRYAGFSPDGKSLALNRQDADRMNWKGYRGGAQQDIWVAGLATKKFDKITDWPGYDIFPMWHASGIYFASDREGGRMNLYRCAPDGSAVTRLTDHGEWDVEFPALGGDRIVYGCSGYLWVYDIAAGESAKLEIEIPSDRWQVRDSWYAPEEFLEVIGLDGTGSLVAAEARGDIYLIDLETERTVNLTRTPGSREISPVPAPDGKLVAFYSDRSGEYELYVSEPRPGAPWTQITSGSSTFYYHVAWSPDSNRLLFQDKDFRLFWAQLGRPGVTEIDRGTNLKDNEIFWEVSDYCWSPDSLLAAYVKVDRNLNGAIFIHDTATGTSVRVTDDRFDDFSPAFGAGGDRLYFLSQRGFQPELDSFMDNNLNVNQTRVMAVALRDGAPPPFSTAAKRMKEDAEQDEDEAAAEVESTAVDYDGLGERIFTVPLEPGTYKALKAAEGRLFYLARERFGFPGIEEFFTPRRVSHWDLMRFDLEEEESETAIPGIGHYELSADGKMAGYISGRTAGVVDAAKSARVGDGALPWDGLRQKAEVFAEYPQIYNEVWRQIRDFFYDPAIHGRDWAHLREKYAPLIPHVATRADMNYIIGHLLGELTASHEYIIGGGDGGPEFDRVGVGLLGADLRPDPQAGCWRIERVLPGVSWMDEVQSPLAEPQVKVADGDCLLAIDGQSLTSGDNPWRLLEDKGGREVELTVAHSPDGAGSRTVTIEALRGEEYLRYYDWIEGNYRTVKEKTGGRVGYIHLTDMDEEGLQQFEQGFRAERYRDGLIIDVRENGGGFVSWFIIDKLERHLTFLAQTRDFEPMHYPHGVHPGPIVVLCDEGTGSDGEVFVDHFRELGLGPVVGMPTWGGLIGIINMIPLTDGGLVTQANVGFANLRGDWVVENRGALPDIYVENRPEDLLAGRDPQLDKAIEVILEKLEREPPPTLVPPAFPVR